MKRRRLRVGRIILLIVIIIVLTTLIITGIKVYKFLQSDEYKLKKIGYDEKEIALIFKYSEKDELENIKNSKYEKELTTFLKEKYFIYDNLKSYIKLYKEDKTVKTSKIVSLVNVGANKEYYSDSTKADISKKELMLVNKYHYLDNDYAPKNIVDVSYLYGYGDNEAPEEIYDIFLEMWNKADEDGLHLIMSSSYRDYDYQNDLYNNYKNQKGSEWADTVAARAGYSEHQTGYALDIVTTNSTMDNFEKSDEFKWLKDNAYKYGFILRYPKGKEDITGYNYESWHYRYVGKDVAKYIYENDITFDEYYAYFIENK